MDGFTIAWLVWLAAFAVIEGLAIAREEPGGTLSEKIWRWFAVKDKSKGFRMRRFVLLAFLAWLTLHFLTGGWV
jgi:hypothetical protein